MELKWFHSSDPKVQEAACVLTDELLRLATLNTDAAYFESRPMRKFFNVLLLMNTQYSAPSGPVAASPVSDQPDQPDQPDLSHE